MIISLFRDGLSGPRYIIYLIICSTLLFSIIGYLLKQKYGKVEFKVATQATTLQASTAKPKKEKKVKTKKAKKSKAVPGTSQVVTPVVQAQPPVTPQVVQTPRPVQQVQQVPTQVQQQVVAPSIPEPTLTAKSGIPAGYKPPVAPQASTTLKQPTAIPDLSQAKTGNPAIDDDITTII